MNTRIKSWGTAGVLMALLLSLTGTALAVVMDAGTRQGRLTEVGPISPETGFPSWYRDSNGLRLEGCYSLDDPLCQALVDEVPDPTQPISFPDNFPGEFFYQLAGATVATPTGELTIGMDLEGAFANEAARAGDQMVFGRIRIRNKDVPDGQTWRITHPYGIDQFTTANGEGINFTEDIGVTPGAFGDALHSRVGPFLRWDPAVAPAAPAGYVGDPNVAHRVVGSPYGTNFVKVERLLDGTWSSIGETDLFTVQGRYATNSGLDVEVATYTASASGDGVLEVRATSESGQTLQLPANPGLGYGTTQFRADGGRYYARVPVSGPVPSGTSIEVVNAGDKPVTTKTVKLVDLVTVTRVEYDADAQVLAVAAASGDQLSTPTLTVEGYGELTGGSASFSDVAVPPSKVTVTSSHGGSATREVLATGSVFGTSAPVAMYQGPEEAQVGQQVSFDGSGSLGDITSYAWSFSAPDGSTTSDTGANVTLTPTQVGTHEVQLSVTGPGGSSTSTGVLSVVAVSDAQADAGPDQTVVRGSQVTLDGSRSTGVGSYSWSQVSGPQVILNGGGSANPGFAYPLMTLPTTGNNSGYVRDNDPLVFELTVTGVNGTVSRDRVTVAPRPEQLTGITARYRTRGEWRVTGTSSIPAGQRVAVVLGSTPTGRLIGNATVDPATGAFSLRNGAAGPGTVRTVTIVSATGGMVTANLTVTS